MLKVQIAAVSAVLLLASAPSFSQGAMSPAIGKQDARKHSIAKDRMGRPITSRYGTKEGMDKDAYR